MAYTVDGQSISVSNEPQQKGGTLWVPLREIAQSMGGTVDWDPDNRIAIVYLGSRIATIKIGDVNVDVDGQNYELQEAPYLADGDTWVPVRFFNQALGYGINVDLGTKQVDFTNTASA